MLCERAVLAAVHGIRVQGESISKAMSSVITSASSQGPEKDANPALAVLRLELLPNALCSLGDGIGRWRGLDGPRRRGDWAGAVGMLLCEERRRNHTRWRRRRLLVLGQATLFVLLAAATRTGSLRPAFMDHPRARRGTSSIRIRRAEPRSARHALVGTESDRSGRRRNNTGGVRDGTKPGSETKPIAAPSGATQRINDPRTESWESGSLFPLSHCPRGGKGRQRLALQRGEKPAHGPGDLNSRGRRRSQTRLVSRIRPRWHDHTTQDP